MINHTTPAAQKVRALITGANSDACILWPGYRNADGYGRARNGREVVEVTHIALSIDGRPRPEPDLYALHSCDNPPCINPHHLRWGTKRDNAEDAMARGRVYLEGLTGGGKERWRRRNAEQSRLRIAALAFTCPVCAAPVGAACPGAKGRRRGAIHRERIRMAS